MQQLFSFYHTSMLHFGHIFSYLWEQIIVYEQILVQKKKSIITVQSPANDTLFHSCKVLTYLY